MADNMIVSCPHCSEKMSVPADYAGLEGHCPKCKQAFVFCEPKKPTVPAVQTPSAKINSPVPKGQPPLAKNPPLAEPRAPVAQAPTSKVQNLQKSGWSCFGVGMILLILCPIIPLYSPFFFASFVIAIILLAKDEGEGGLSLLLTTLLMPIAVGVAIFMLGVGTILAAFFGFVKEVESKQNAFVSQQQTALNQLSGQQSRFSQLAPAKPVSSQPIFLQPPAVPAPQPPVARPLPSKEITYDGLLALLNRFSIEFKAATTTAQKQDVRSRAQRAAGDFVDNARVTLAGTVGDIQYGSDGVATLTVGSFSSPDYDNQGQKTLLFIPATGKLKVPMTREAVLAVKSGQKIWVTGRLQVSPTTTMMAGFGEVGSPSLLFIQFRDDIDMLLTLRVVDYTVSFDDKRGQASLPAKKNDYLIVVPPKSSP